MMDDEMKDKVMAGLEDLGIDKDKIDDRLVWGAKKVMIGLMKMRWSLKDSGMDAEEVDEVLKKAVDKMLDKDMLDQMEEMHQDHDHDWKKE